MQKLSLSASIVALAATTLALAIGGLLFGMSGDIQADARGVMDAPQYSIALSPR
jgi:hypothetical protein